MSWFNALQALDSSTSRYLRSSLLQNGATSPSLQQLRWQPHHLPWALLAAQLVAMQPRQCLQSRVAPCCQSMCLRGLCSTWVVVSSSYLLPPLLLILSEVCDTATETARQRYCCDFDLAATTVTDFILTVQCLRAPESINSLFNLTSRNI